MAYVILNHQLLEAEKAHISVEDRGFRFGDGIFETMAVHESVPYQFDWHMARLSDGLAAIRIDFDTSPLKALCKTLLIKNAVSGGLLRIQITRGIGSRGYLPHGNTPTLVIETLPMPPKMKPINTLWLSSYEKISPAALPVQYKLAQGLNSTLARMEADDHRCLDALLLNAQKQITETSSSSIFWLRDDVLYMPSLSCGALNSSVRNTILRVSPYETKEVAAELSALSGADAVCIGNVAWGIVAIDALMPTGFEWKSNVLAEALNQTLKSDIVQHTQSHSGFWKSA